MLTRIIGVLSAAMLILGLGSAMTPASADQRPCVSWQEYQNIKWQYPPATMGRVHDHFDTRGRILSRSGPPGHRDVVRAYPKCRDWGRGYAVVWFDNYSWDWRMRTWAVAPSIRAFQMGNFHNTQ